MNEKLKENPFFTNAAWVTYITPFCLIHPFGEQPKEISLEEVNSLSYNHGDLCRIVGLFDNLLNDQYKAVICGDGALAIPSVGQYQTKESAIDYFNRILCQLLLGGIACEAVDQRDLVWGQLFKRRFIWPVDMGHSSSSKLHAKLRSKFASSFDSWVLHGTRQISFKEFQSARHIGEQCLTTVKNLTPSFLIKGATEIRYHNWSLALMNIWVSIEQITDFLWNTRFIANCKSKNGEVAPGRIKSLKNDNRTWSSSVKHEILFQAGVITERQYNKLYPARQARNRLVHEGIDIVEEIAVGAFEVLTELLSMCFEDHKLSVNSMDIHRGIEKGSIKKDHSLFNEWRELTIE